MMKQTPKKAKRDIDLKISAEQLMVWKKQICDFLNKFFNKEIHDTQLATLQTDDLVKKDAEVSTMFDSWCLFYEKNLESKEVLEEWSIQLLHPDDLGYKTLETVSKALDKYKIQFEDQNTQDKMLNSILIFFNKIKNTDAMETFERVIGVLEEKYSALLQRWYKLYTSTIEDEQDVFFQELLTLNEFAKTALSPISKSIQSIEEDDALRLALEQKVREKFEEEQRQLPEDHRLMPSLIAIEIKTRLNVAFALEKARQLEQLQKIGTDLSVNKFLEAGDERYTKREEAEIELRAEAQTKLIIDAEARSAAAVKAEFEKREELLRTSLEEETEKKLHGVKRRYEVEKEGLSSELENYRLEKIKLEQALGQKNEILGLQTEKLNSLETEKQHLLLQLQTLFFKEQEIGCLKQVLSVAQQSLSETKRDLASCTVEIERLRPQLQIQDDALIAARQATYLSELELAAQKEETERVHTQLQIQGDELVVARIELEGQKRDTQTAQNSVQTHLNTIQRLEAALLSAQLKNIDTAHEQAARLAEAQAAQTAQAAQLSHIQAVQAQAAKAAQAVQAAQAAQMAEALRVANRWKVL
jgi:hypothetical protein